MTVLLTREVDICPVEGLISRPMELIEVPSLFFSFSMAQYVKSTPLLNLMVITEISDMVKLVKRPSNASSFTI